MQCLIKWVLVVVALTSRDPGVGGQITNIERDIISSDTQLTVTWDAPSSTPDNYLVRLTEVADSEKNVTSPTATFGGLMSCMGYTVEVEAVTGDTGSEMLYTNPSPVTDLTVGTVTSNSVMLSWTEPSPTCVDYRIQIILSSTVVKTERATGSGTVISGLSQNTAYTAVIVTTGNNLLSSQRSEQFTTLPTKPDPPTNIQRASGSSATELQVTWTAPGSTHDSFLARLNGVENSQRTVMTMGSLGTTFDSLTSCTQYTVEVEAVNQEVSSDTATAMFYTNPSPVTNIGSTVTTNSVTLTWTEPTPTCQGYHIEVRVGSSTGNIVRMATGVTGSSTEISGLSPDTMYTAVIETMGYNDLMSVQATKEFTTGALPTSTPVRNDAATTTNSITVSWAPPTDTSTFAVYVIDIKDSSTYFVNRTLPNNATGDMFINLSPGTSYTICLSTETNAGLRSDPECLNTATRPNPPSGLMQDVGRTTSDRLVVTWMAPQSGEAQSYTVTPSGQSSVTGTEATITTNSPCSEVDVMVQTSYGGLLSSEIRQTFYTKPDALMNINVPFTDYNDVRATWMDSACSTDLLYMYYFANASGSPVTVTENSTSAATLNTLLPSAGAVYTFCGRVVSNGLLGELNCADFYTRSLPVQNVRVTTTPNTAVVTWTTSPLSTQVEFSISYRGLLATTDLPRQTVKSSGEEVQLTELFPGERYSVIITAVNGDAVASDEQTTYFVTNPLPPIRIFEGQKATSTVNITWGHEESRTYLTGWDVMYTLEGVSQTERVMTTFAYLTGLTAGGIYDIQVYAVSVENKTSLSYTNLTVVIIPSPPILECDRGTTQFTLYIRKQGYVDTYDVMCDKCNVQNVRLQWDVVSYLYKDLTPNDMYRVSAVSNRLGLTSEEVQVTCNTTEGPPGPVEAFEVTILNPNEVELTWQPPRVKNGILKEYTITYIGMKAGRHDTMRVFLDVTETSQAQYSLRVSNLLAGYNYTFTITASTTSAGPERSITKVTPVSAPKLITGINPSDFVRPDTKTHDQISVCLRNPFTNDNGEVIEFSVIVTTDRTDSDIDIPDLSGWAGAQKNNKASYFAVRRDPQMFRGGQSRCSNAGVAKRQAGPQETSFTIGDQNCNRNALNEFCNGPLKPETNYYVIVRGYNENGDFTNGPISEAITTDAPPGSSNVGLIVGVVCGVLVVLAVVLIAGAIYWKKRKTDSGSEHHRPPVPIDLFSNPVKEKTSNSMKVSEFANHVANMSADSEFGFADEYESLRNVGKDQPAEACELSCNRLKNRFFNIIPYDHSRVKLLPTDEEEGSDYINANWMPGYFSKREYIVTQGALPSTRDDFWRMIWEFNCRAIVMLTRCVENHRQRCDHYWPMDGEPMFYGDLQVMIIHETKTPEWVLTEFKLSKGDKTRTIKHFHYVIWPDMGVPTNMSTLIRFVRLVRSKMDNQGGPIVIHCSAGVGRSGTFLALDRIMNHIKEHDDIDVYGVVYEMRLNRVLMVQTERQYIFLHQCLLSVIEKREDFDTTEVTEGQTNPAFDDPSDDDDDDDSEVSYD